MTQVEIPIEQIDIDAKRIIDRLVAHHYEAYLVGGCVRDLLLGYPPKDFDIATSATPSEIKRLFRNSRIIGRRFRLVHLFYGEKLFQVATFRAPPIPSEEFDKNESEDFLIRSDNVFGTAQEDAERRDFTINGLFYQVQEGQVIDYVGGMNDLRKRQIRMIGDPHIRFREDPVRALRAIRFSARLGFDIEDRTYSALITHRKELSKSAPPRLIEELYKIFRCGASLESFVLLREARIVDILLPRLAQALKENPFSLEHYLQKLDHWISKEIAVENATLLFILGAADFELLAQKFLSTNKTLFDERMAQGIDSLLEQLAIPRRDIELLQGALLKNFWPLYHRVSRKDPEKQEAAASQILELFLSVHPTYSPAPFNEKTLVAPSHKRKRPSRRRGPKKTVFRQTALASSLAET